MIFEGQATEANNIDLQDTDKLQHFAKSKFNNNGVIIRSLSLFFVDVTTHEQTIICRQLFIGHMVGSGLIKKDRRKK